MLVAATLADVKITALKPLAGVVAAGLLLSACTPSGGTAAEVAGQRIPESQVDATIEGCESVGFPLVDGQNTTRANVAFSLAAGEVVRQAESSFAEALPEPSAVEEALSASFPAEILGNAECKQFLSDSFSFNLALQNLQTTLDQDEFATQFGDVIGQINLNPRYGRIKMQENGFPQIVSGSMSTDASGQ